MMFGMSATTLNHGCQFGPVKIQFVDFLLQY